VSAATGVPATAVHEVLRSVLGERVARLARATPEAMIVRGVPPLGVIAEADDAGPVIVVAGGATAVEAAAPGDTALVADGRRAGPGCVLGAGSWRADTGGCEVIVLSTSLAAASDAAAEVVREALIAVAARWERQRWGYSGSLHCDADHPAIGDLAGRLSAGTDAETAYRVWEFVRVLAYRFGGWHLAASATLALGSGMCTTKANLQVALMRAAGLRAGFTEVVMPAASAAGVDAGPTPTPPTGPGQTRLRRRAARGALDRHGRVVLPGVAAVDGPGIPTSPLVV